MLRKKIKKASQTDLKKLYAYFEDIDNAKLRKLVDVAARQHYQRTKKKPYNKRRVSTRMQIQMLQGLKGYKTEEIEAMLQNFGIIPPPPEVNEEGAPVEDDGKEYYIEGEKVSKAEFEKNGHKGGHAVVTNKDKVR